MPISKTSPRKGHCGAAWNQVTQPTHPEGLNLFTLLRTQLTLPEGDVCPPQAGMADVKSNPHCGTTNKHSGDDVFLKGFDVSEREPRRGAERRQERPSSACYGGWVGDKHNDE